MATTDELRDGPFKRELIDPEFTPQPGTETEFEKQRGIHSVDIREGFLRVHVSGLEPPLMPSRLKVLRLIADAQVSIDFLKFTASGLSFVAPMSAHAALEQALGLPGLKVSISSDRCILLVHAANMRDEEGLIAEIVSAVIASGGEVDHMGDMHDRVLLVLPRKDADRLAEMIQQRTAGDRA